MTQHARGVLGGALGRALAPEILQRVQAHRRHAVPGEPRGQLLVEAGPAAVTGEEQRELPGDAAGAHLDHRQIRDFRRPRRRRLGGDDEARVGIAKLRHPVALDSEAVADERQPHDLAVCRARGELIGRVRLTYLVLLTLQRDPGLLQIRGGLEHELAPLVRPVAEPGARAERRPGKVLVGAEAEAERAGEGPRRGLDQRRIDHGGARGITDEHRHVILAHPDLFLHLVAERLEIGGDHLARRAGVRRTAQAPEVLPDVGSDHHRPHGGERARHADDPELPAAVAREEDRDAACCALGNVDGDGAEARAREVRRIDVVGGGRVGAGRVPSGGCRCRRGGRRCRRGRARRGEGAGSRPDEQRSRDQAPRRPEDHLVNSSFTPPAISTDTSTSTRGSAIPPRATR